MEETIDETGDGVGVTVEITGGYGDVVSKLRTPTSEYEPLSTVTADLSILLDTVVQLDGGTRSAIADELPSDMARGYDTEDVVNVLQVLAHYDLVVLDGNTWRPGPALRK